MSDYSLAIVTGAAQRLGRLFALTLAHKGYAILLHYHRSEGAALFTTNEIRALGVPVHPVKADLTDASQIRQLYTILDSLHFQLKILVNSAALMKRADLGTISADEWDSTLALNLRAPLLMAQNAASRMGDGGIIINITDAGIGKAWASFPDYLVSKSGLEVLTRLLAKKYAPTIRVNAIAPGLVMPSSFLSKEEWQRLINRLPLMHPASEADLGAALEYILQNESVTGQTIVVDGGYSLI